MDEQTALVLALQLVALFSIAGALLVYLLCKIQPSNNSELPHQISGTGKAILVTCADTCIGLQISIHLATRGFRVFAGLKDASVEDSTPWRVIRAWQKYRESLAEPRQGALIGLPFDVTREDLLHESVDIIRAHLPAGEDGIWAVINTSGLSYRGRLDQQDIAHWDAILKANVVGVLRVARTFQGLLRNTCGRLINIGAPDFGGESGLVAYVASRYAVEGACQALRVELNGIGVATLKPNGITPEMLFVAPKLKHNANNEISVDMSGCLEYQPLILTSTSLKVLDDALTAKNLKFSYDLVPKKPLSFIRAFIV